MKKKKKNDYLDLRVSSPDDFFDIIESIIKEPDNFDRFPDNVIFARDFETIHKILTEKRLELIRAINVNPDKNIDALAKILHRKREAVSRDLGILEGMGIIELKRKGKSRIPFVQKHYIIVTLA